MRTLCACALLGILTACGAPAATSDAEVMARVGNTVINRSELIRSIPPGSTPEQAKQVLDQLIEVELVVQAARRDGVGADTKKVDEQVEQIRQAQGGGTEEGLQKFLEENGIESTEKLREVLVRQQLIDAMILKHATVEQARARHILLLAEGEDKLAERKAEAEQLLKEVQDGADFAKTAQDKSEDPGSSQQGGDLGWQPRGVFVPEFDEAMFSMKKDEIRLVSSQFGWHVIQLTDEAQKRGFENREEMNSPAGQQAFQESFLPWVKSLREEADKSGIITLVGDPTTAIPTAAPAPTGAAPDGAAPSGTAAPEAPPAATPAP